MAKDSIVYDVDSYDIITTAIKELLNKYPGLSEDDEIAFSVIAEEDGKAFFPTSGAVVLNEIRDITGHIEQTCLYPFIVMFKASGLSETGKANAKEWLDNLGKWLERQLIMVNGVQYQLTKYPTLTGNRELMEIKRTTPSYLLENSTDRVDSWAINITAQYRNEYDKI